MPHRPSDLVPAIDRDILNMLEAAYPSNAVENTVAVVESSTQNTTRSLGQLQRGDRVRVINNSLSQYTIPIGTIFTYGEENPGGFIWQDFQLELVGPDVETSNLLELGYLRTSSRAVHANESTRRFFWADSRQDLSLSECGLHHLPVNYSHGCILLGTMPDAIVIKFSTVDYWKIICANKVNRTYFWGWNAVNLTLDELQAEGLPLEYLHDPSINNLTVDEYLRNCSTSTRSADPVVSRETISDQMEYAVMPPLFRSRSGRITPMSTRSESEADTMSEEGAAMGEDPVVYQGKWPIGTIIKLDLRKHGVDDFIRSNGHSVEFPLVKVTKYSESGNIIELIWIGEIEPDHTSIETLYFTETSPKEVEEYQRQLAELRPCTTRPAIGTLLKYIGKGSKKGLCGLMIAEARNNRIVLKWTSREREGERSTYDFNLFQISKRQIGAFTPDFRTYCRCKSCNSLRSLSEYPSSLRKIGNDIYCDNACAVDAGHNYCRDCGNWHLVTQMITLSRNVICQACHTTHYRECADCGNWCNVGSMRRTHLLELQCESCARHGSEVIREYSFKPAPRPVKMAWENTRYLGIELEIEADERTDIKILATQVRSYLKGKTKPEGKVLDKLVYFKNDGSLRNGVEIVFHPFTLQALHKHFPVKDFLTYIPTVGGRISDRCGMHVHVSKKRLSNRQLLNGKWFFHKCQSYLESLSDRNGQFNYCAFEGIPSKDPYKQPYGRKTAFNVAASAETLEVRLFRSTLNYSKFMANVQFADVFVDYIQHGSGSAFLQRATGKQIWEDFLDYSKRNGQYQTMTNWVSQKGIV